MDMDGEHAFITSHPMLSIPQPHKDDHVGLAQFTSGSIIPMLRFYSAVYRTFILLSIALIFISRPLAKLIQLYGWDSPAYFQKKVGTPVWYYRSLDDSVADKMAAIYEWITKEY